MIASLTTLAATLLIHAADAGANDPTITVLFSPHGGCTAAIVAEIDAAQTSVRIQAYSFTSARIAKAVVNARKRGVHVEAVLDKSNRTAKYSAATFLANHGVTVLIDARHAIAHNKIILIDDRVVITGSFNFSRAAEQDNAENLLIFEDHADLLAAYMANYQQHRAHSDPYKNVR